MIAILLPFLALALALSFMSWQAFRPKKWLFPSDVFYILCFITSGLVPFINLRGEAEQAAESDFSDQTIQIVLISLIIMYLSFAVVWMLRKDLVITDIVYNSKSNVIESDREVKGRTRQFLVASLVVFFIGSAVFLVYPPYLQFKGQVLQFVTGNISASDYQVARRLAYAEDNIIVGFMGRLRYAVFPILFVASSIYLVKKFGIYIGFLMATVGFLLGPASFAKAPMVIYLIYFSIAMVIFFGIRKPFLARSSFFVIGCGLVVVQILVTGVYFLQYREHLFGFEGLNSAFGLAFFRVFGANYNGLLMYIATFPEGDVGFDGLSIVSVFGRVPRLMDQEVAIYIMGYDLGRFTTYPTIFIGNAYASFGYIGVAIYSLIVGFVMYWIDLTFSQIRTRVVRNIYYPVMLVNVCFFSQLSAQTALITYGGFTIPFALMFLDRIIVGGHHNFRARMARA
jgi:hypothetical protein